MTFLVRRGTPLHQVQLKARALNAWRESEEVVRSRWDSFLVADRASRRYVFAAYVAALDAEETAAADLAAASYDVAEAA